jgi:hypothetical protein
LLKLFPNAESILVGDCPLQWADWPWLCRQSVWNPSLIVKQEFRWQSGFRDLRKEVFRRDANNFLLPSDDEHGDPRGYQGSGIGPSQPHREISDQSEKFAVNDYSAA